MNQNKTLNTSFWLCITFSILFAVIIGILGSRLSIFSHIPDQGPLWYFWQLAEPTEMSRITSWAGYILHQLAVWIIAIIAIRKWRVGPLHADSRENGALDANGRQKGTPLTNLNKIMLGVNLLFIILHFIQTHVWYDGIAQDVPVWTSQLSVIFMLILILIMLNRKRGLVWGKKFPIPEPVEKFVRKYHGIYISWALVYTFWFHPMEGFIGFTSGFLYMFFLFTQMSLFKTRIHFNLLWITFLEFFVVIHGTLVPIMKQQTVWPMFLGGFLLTTLLTQIHGLPLKKWMKAAAVIIYLAVVIPSYSVRGYNMIYEVVFIPLIFYIGVYLVTGLTYAGLKIARKA